MTAKHQEHHGHHHHKHLSPEEEAKRHIQQRNGMIFGLILATIISVISIALGELQFFKKLGFSAVTISIVLGIIVGNTFYKTLEKNYHVHVGVNFAKSKLLRLGIILFGFKLTFKEVASIGINGVIVDALVLTSTFLLCLYLGKLMKMDKQTVMLIGAGSSICGAAAVMASEPVVRAHAEKVSVAVATVVLYGTIAMFLYPEIYHWKIWAMSDNQFGVYIGSTIHEVAQVYAAGATVSDEVLNIAVTSKMVRVMMLAPFLLVLAIVLGKHSRHEQQDSHHHNKKKIVIPWFAVLFIVMVGVHSLVPMNETLVTWLITISGFCLTMAMGSLGLTTHIGAIKQAGIKPLLLAAILFVWLIVAGGFLELLLPS